MTTQRLKLRVKLLMLALLMSVAGALVYTAAHAQTFTASVTQGQAPLSTVLTWSVPGATSCTAGSTPGWTGSVPASGTRTLTGISVPLKLTLDCTAQGSATVTWTHGADIAGLTRTGYLLSATPQAISGQVPVNVDLKVPGATAYKFDGLAPGPYLLSVQTQATNSAGATLASSAVTATPAGAAAPGPFTVAGGTTHREIQLTILPNPPTGVTTVQDPTAFEIKTSSTGTLVATRIGLVPVGTACDASTRRVVAGIAYTRIPRDAVDVVNFSSSTGLKAWVPEVYAKCS